MGWTKAVTMAACLAAGAAFAQSSMGGTGAAPDKSTDTKSTDTTKSDTYKSESKSTTKDSKAAAPKGTTADKDKDTSATGTGGSSTTPDTTKK